MKRWNARGDQVFTKSGSGAESSHCGSFANGTRSFLREPIRNHSIHVGIDSQAGERGADAMTATRISTNDPRNRQALACV